jgi:subtilisin family serine protease
VARLQAAFPRRAARARETTPSPGFLYLLTVGDASGVQDLCAALAGDPEVLYAEPNQVLTVEMVPDDPYYSSSGSWGQAGLDDLWGLKQMNTGAAWDLRTGSGIVVAVVDSGIDYTHEDIAANLWQNPGETAANGHGTHGAGTVAATGNNSVGVVGVAYGARVMAVKGFDQYGNGSTGAIYNGMLYAIDNGADVINCSFGGSGNSLAITDAVQQALDGGCIVVCAAGNSAVDARYVYPANIDGTIAVGAVYYHSVLQGLRRANYSNFGSKVDLYAPGGSSPYDILSLLAAGSEYASTKQTYVVGERYLRLAGTSMAAPHVSGLVALLLEGNPDLTTEQVRYILRNTATDLGAAGWDGEFSFGLANAAAAVAFTGAAPDLTSAITAPAFGLSYPDNVVSRSALTVTGTAAGPGFQRYEVARSAASPVAFQTLYTDTQPRVDQTLAALDTSTWADGEYYLRVRAYDGSGAFTDCLSGVFVDSSAKTGWPQLADLAWSSIPQSVRYTHNGYQTPTFADLDGDGTKEVICVAWRYLFVWTHEGAVFGPAFPLYLSRINETRTAPAVADLDGDGDQEIVLLADVVPTEAPLYAFHHDGTPVAGFPCGNPDPAIPNYVRRISSYYGPAIGDLDGDGSPEIVFAIGTYNTNYARTYLAAVDSQGAFKPGWPVAVSTGTEFAAEHYWPRSPVAVHDLDGDGLQEVLIVKAYDELKAGFVIYGADGQLRSEITFSHGSRSISRLLAADWNGDGQGEVSVFVYRPDLGYAVWDAHLLGMDGTERPGWPQTVYRRYVLDASFLCDVDGDGKLELAFLGGEYMSDYLYAFTYEGTPVPGMGIDLTPTGYLINGSVQTQDVIPIRTTSADGLAFVYSGYLMNVCMLAADGGTLPVWPKPIVASLGSPAVADLDGNGKVEIGFRSAEGLVYIWEEPSTYTGSALSEWPALYGGNRRTCSTVAPPAPPPPPPVFDDLADADLPVAGTVTGTYADTHASDNVYQILREVLSGGKANSRCSYLEHKWTVSVAGGTSVTLFVEAHHSVSTDGDHFVFAYSTDGSAFSDALTVTKTADDDAPQSAVLPASVAGTVFIRVRDTDRTARHTSLDTLYVDRLFIRSEGVDARPPEPAAGPSPATGATGVSTFADLGWTAGARATSHDVFFGTNPTPGTAEFRGNTTAASFDPGTLAPNTTYYWRIDELGRFGRTAGPVWSFTTGAAAPEVFVNGIAMGSRKAGKNVFAQATVWVRDTTGADVGGAAVSGTWAGAASGPASGSTQADGRVLLESPGSKTGGTFTFTVTNVAKAGMVYNPARNVQTSASITVP